MLIIGLIFDWIFSLTFVKKLLNELAICFGSVIVLLLSIIHVGDGEFLLLLFIMLLMPFQTFFKFNLFD